MDDITVLIKAYKRPDVLRRLLLSLRKFYPTMPAVVVDDSPTELSAAVDGIPGVNYIRVDHDIGLSEGRNRGLAAVQTSQFLLCDDDFRFDHRTNLKRLHELKAAGQFDILAGLVFDYYHGRSATIKATVSTALSLKFRHTRRILREHRNGTQRHFYGTYKTLNDVVFGIPAPLPAAGAASAHYVINFFLADTQKVRDFGGWDADLKMGEHEEFFYRLYLQRANVGFTPEVGIRHYPLARNRVNRELIEQTSKPLFLRKHNIKAFTRYDLHHGETLFAAGDEQTLISTCPPWRNSAAPK